MIKGRSGAISGLISGLCPPVFKRIDLGTIYPHHRSPAIGEIENEEEDGETSHSLLVGLAALLTETNAPAADALCRSTQAARATAELARRLLPVDKVAEVADRGEHDA